MESDVGELEGGDLHHAGDVEVESFGALARHGLNLDVVDAAVEGLVLGGDKAQKVDDVILVLGSDDDPGLLFGALAARHDGGNESVEAVLPHGGAGIFLLLLEDVDVEVHLVEVEHVVVERQFGILLDAVALGAGVWLLVVELLDHVAVDALAEGVVILLEGVTIVEVAPGLDREGGVVAVIGAHQLGIVVGVVGIGDDLTNVVEVHLLDRKLAGLVALGHLLCLSPARCHCCDGDKDGDEDMFHWDVCLCSC